jgi:hypothetical protein
VLLIDEQKVAKDPTDPQIQRQTIQAAEALSGPSRVRRCPNSQRARASRVGARPAQPRCLTDCESSAGRAPSAPAHGTHSPMDRCFPLRGAGASGAAHGAAEAEVGRGGQHRGARQPPSQGRYRGICRSTFCRLRCPSTAPWAATAARAAGRRHSRSALGRSQRRAAEEAVQGGREGGEDTAEQRQGEEEAGQAAPGRPRVQGPGHEGRAATDRRQRAAARAGSTWPA